MSYRPSGSNGHYAHRNEKLYQRVLPRLQRLQEHSNKENLYAIPRRQYPLRGLRRGDSESDLPTTSTQVGGMEPVCFDKHLRERELFSTSSSMSDEELELSRKKRRERFSTHYSTSDLTTSDSSIGPSWITANRRFIPIPSFRHNPTNSTTSLECSDNLKTEEFELDNEDENDLDSENSDQEEDEVETQQNKNIGLLAEMRRLDSIEEMSPVLPVPIDIYDDQDLPPKLTPVRFATSTQLSRFPTTNPHHQQSTTPHLSTRRMCDFLKVQPRSIFEIKPARSEEFGLPSQMAKFYGIKGILFMTISMTGFRSTQLSVSVQHGAYFLQRYPELSTYVIIEIKGNKRLKKRSKATETPCVYRSNLIRRTHQPDFNYDAMFPLTKENFSSHDKLGISVYATNTDDFADANGHHELLGCMTFSLRRLREKAKDTILNKMASRTEESRVKVCDGGYFLLGPKHGDNTNMPQDKIYHRKFYDDIGSTDVHSNFESPPHSSKMMGESDWRTAFNYKDSKLDPRRHSIQVGSSQRIPLNGRPAASNQQHFYPSAAVAQQYYNNQEIGPLPKPEHRYGPLGALISGSPRKKVSLQARTISTDQHIQRRKDVLMSKGGASSSNSSSSSSAGYKSHYRFTLPSITTTTDSSECTNGSSTHHAHLDPSKKHVDQHLLYAESAPTAQPSVLPHSKPIKARSNTQKALPTASSHRFLTNQPSVSSADDKNAPHHGTVRRVASFTYSTDEKHNKQGGKKFTFAPLSKLGGLIKGKADAVNSTSTLYPNREDVRLWGTSFDSLLFDKLGRHLFRQFVNCEYSSENLDFYEDVEEFKKLKPGKKTTVQRGNDIFNTYFKEGAKKELNLDSATKQSTLAAYKAGCLPDTFNLAQSRIEQLMAKDSYARFIHSKPYLDLLNSVTPPPSATNTNAPSSIPPTASIETSEPTNKPEKEEVASPKAKSESPAE